MGKAFGVISTAVVTATLTSAFWIFAYNTRVFSTAEAGKVTASGDIAVVDPASGPPVAIAESVEVGPAGLAIPVAGVKAGQLTDTFTQARAGGGVGRRGDPGPQDHPVGQRVAGGHAVAEGPRRGLGPARVPAEDRWGRDQGRAAQAQAKEGAPLHLGGRR